MRSFILSGGNPPLKKEYMKELLAQKNDPKIVILALYREEWKNYIEEKYIQPFIEIGVASFHTILGDKVSEDEIIDGINKADILIISGGETTKYQETYCKETIRRALLKRNESGLPVIGFSAGAIIMGDKIAISPHDNKEQITLYRKGLGIYNDFLIGVHYSKWADQQHLKEAKKVTEYERAFGLDNQAYITFNETRGIDCTEGVHPM
jgi:cyanophycinase